MSTRRFHARSTLILTLLIWFGEVLQRRPRALRARRLVASVAIAAGLLACGGPRPAPSYPVAERAGLVERVDWHRALGDPAWGWPRYGGLGWELGPAAPTRTLAGPIAPELPARFGIDPAHAELLESHRPLRTWSRPIRAIW